MTTIHYLLAAQAFTTDKPELVEKLRAILAELGASSPVLCRTEVRPELDFGTSRTLLIQLPHRPGVPFQVSKDQELRSLSKEEVKLLREHGVCLHILVTGPHGNPTAAAMVQLAGHHGFAVSPKVTTKASGHRSKDEPENHWMLLQVPPHVDVN